MLLKIWWKIQLPLLREKYTCVYAHEICLWSQSLWAVWSLPIDLPTKVHELWVKNFYNKCILCFCKMENVVLVQLLNLSFFGAYIWKEFFLNPLLYKKLWLSYSSCLALKWGPISFGSNPKLLVSWLSKCLTTIDTLMKSKWVKFNTSFWCSLQMFLIRTLKKSLEA